jgi:hypothetical protein
MVEEGFDPGCAGKTPYASKADAVRSIQFRQKARRAKLTNGRGQLNAYRCTSCAYWHVGSHAMRLPHKVRP